MLNQRFLCFVLTLIKSNLLRNSYIRFIGIFHSNSRGVSHRYVKKAHFYINIPYILYNVNKDNVCPLYRFDTNCPIYMSIFLSFYPTMK